MRARFPLSWLFALALAAVLAGPAPVGAGRGYAPGSVQMPEFSLLDLGGKQVKSADLLGKGPILIDYWATWCGPCRRSMPALQQIYNDFSGRGLQVWAISIDGANTKRQVQPFLEHFEYTFPVLLDPNNQTTVPLNVRSIPQTFLFDSDGTLLYHSMGYAPGSERALVEEIERRLPAEKAGA